jgi:hypothetical protein
MVHTFDGLPEELLLAVRRHAWSYHPHPPEVALCPCRLQLGALVRVSKRLCKLVQASKGAGPVAVQDVQQGLLVILTGASLNSSCEFLDRLFEFACIKLLHHVASFRSDSTALRFSSGSP